MVESGQFGRLRIWNKKFKKLLLWGTGGIWRKFSFCSKKTIPSSPVKYIYFFLLFFWGKILLLDPYYLKLFTVHWLGPVVSRILVLSTLLEMMHWGGGNSRRSHTLLSPTWSPASRRASRRWAQSSRKGAWLEICFISLEKIWKSGFLNLSSEKITI